MIKVLFLLATLIYSCKTQNNEPSIITNSDTTMVRPESIAFLNSKFLEPKKIEPDSTFALICEYQDLSHCFNFQINFTRVLDVYKYRDSCLVQVKIIDKKKQLLVDTLNIQSNNFYGNVFKNCDNVRSYTTGKNKDKKYVDNYFGDFVVADFNFDSKEDIAIINDSGGNGGVFYSYFLQGKNKQFYLDEFLTDSMVYFPSKFIKKRKTLVSYSIAGICGLGENKYRYNKKLKEWKEVSHRIIDICNDKK